MVRNIFFINFKYSLKLVLGILYFIKKNVEVTEQSLLLML